MKKLIVPKFSTEAEEAVWWDSHMDVVEENLVEAIQGGTASAERLSARKGLSSEAYLQSLLHEALEREAAGE